MRRLTPYVLLALLALGSGLGIGLGLSEAPHRSVAEVATQVTARVQTPEPFYAEVWMQPSATARQATELKNALALIRTVDDCRILTTADIGKTVSARQSTAFIASDHAPNVKCLLPAFTASVRSGLTALERSLPIAAIAVNLIVNTPSSHRSGRWVATTGSGT